MKLLQFLGSMYGCATLSMLILAGIGSYVKQAIPINLIIAIAICSILDVLIKKLILKNPVKFPASALITGIIIGSVAQFTAPLWVILLASVLAIVSKFVIKLKGQHIFNPAVFGLLISLFIFSSGDEWWSSITFSISGYSVLLTPFLIIPNFKALKPGVSLSFLLITGMLFYATTYVPLTLSISGFTDFLYALPYFFSFIMVSEPKTSPYRLVEQIIFGVLIALFAFVLLFYNVKFYMLISLLVGNFGFALFRTYYKQSKSEK